MCQCMMDLGAAGLTGQRLAHQYQDIHGGSNVEAR